MLEESIIDNFIQMTHSSPEDDKLAWATLETLWPQMSLEQKYILIVFSNWEYIVASNTLWPKYIESYPRLKGGNWPTFTTYSDAVKWLGENKDKLVIKLIDYGT